MTCDPTKSESTNTGFIEMGQKQRKEIEMYGRIHICNVPKFLLRGIKLQIKFTKGKFLPDEYCCRF